LTSPSGGNDVSDDVLAKSSSRVPPLSKRWENGMTFGKFLEKTFQMYYDSDASSNSSNNNNTA
jgi:hypothetical protein